MVSAELIETTRVAYINHVDVEGSDGIRFPPERDFGHVSFEVRHLAAQGIASLTERRHTDAVGVLLRGAQQGVAQLCRRHSAIAGRDQGCGTVFICKIFTSLKAL